MARIQHRRLGARGFDTLADRGSEIAVGQHRTLGQAGGAAGVLQHRERIGRIGDGMTAIVRAMIQQTLEAAMAIIRCDRRQLLTRGELAAHRLRMPRHLGEIADHQRLQPRGIEQARHLRIEQREIERDHNVGLAVLDLVLQHLGGIERRVVDHRAARLQHAEEADEIVRRIGQVEPDMDPRSDAEHLEAFGGAAGERVELAVADAPSHEFDRRLIRPLRRGILQDLLHGHDRNLGIPAHARRIGLDPKRAQRRVGHGGFLLKACWLVAGKDDMAQWRLDRTSQMAPPAAAPSAEAVTLMCRP